MDHEFKENSCEVNKTNCGTENSNSEEKQESENTFENEAAKEMDIPLNMDHEFNENSCEENKPNCGTENSNSEEKQESENTNENEAAKGMEYASKESVKILSIEVVHPSPNLTENATGAVKHEDTINTIINANNEESVAMEAESETQAAEISKLNTEYMSGDVFVMCEIKNDNASTTEQAKANNEPDAELDSQETSNEGNSTCEIDENHFVNQTPVNTTTGLDLLAQYSSDDEGHNSDASVVEVVPSRQNYRSNVVEIDSDTDSDDSSSDSDAECLQKLRKTIEKRMQADDDDDSDDIESQHTGQRRKPVPKVKVKGELQLEDLPPIEDLQITVPEDQCIEIGKITSIVDQLVLVSALPNAVLLDLETVLFLDKGQRVLGAVFDVLGQVADPMYCVRFNSNQQINDKNIHIDDKVFVAPKTQYTQYIILSSLMKNKGSDASWENDLEPPPRYLDYSDDEQEQLARRKMRNRDRTTESEDPEKRVKTEPGTPEDTARNRPQNHQQRQRHRLPPRGQAPQPHQSNYNQNRPPYEPQYGNSQASHNHHANSWHSNYYPLGYAPVPLSNTSVPGGAGFAHMPIHAYPPAPLYPMPILFPQQPQVGPPNSHPSQQTSFSPSTFNMRRPTIPGPFGNSGPPPPPGTY